MADSQRDLFGVLKTEEVTLMKPIQETTPATTRVQEIIVSGGKKERQSRASLEEDKHSEAVWETSSEKEPSNESEKELLGGYVVISKEEAITSANTEQLPAVPRDTVASGKWNPKACFKRLKDKVLSKFDKHSEAEQPAEVDRQFEARESPEIEKQADKRNTKVLGNEAELSSSIVCEETGEQ